LPQYDAAGNMISGPNRDNNTVSVYYTFDAWNRLIEVSNDLVVLQVNEYDGLNRRIKKADDLGWGYRFYYNLDWQMLEAREVSGVGEIYSIDQYLWSPSYVDSPLVCLHDGNASGDVSDDYPTDWRRYYLTDANHNVTTTIRFDNFNSITYDGITRNVYTPYGKVTRLDENWTGVGVEEYFDSPLYAGYFFDFETALYQVRNRYYDAGLSLVDQASFWLGGMIDFEANGSYDIRFSPDTRKSKNTIVEVKNVSMKWRWVDDIDAHSLREYNWSTDSWVQGIAEGIVGDLIGDKLLNSDFLIHVNFNDTTSRKRTILPNGTIVPYI